MQNHTKILILLLIPTFWVGMHFFPKEMGYFTHPIKRYLLLGVYLFPFILLPYLASRKYNFKLRKFLKTFFIMFIIFILYLGIMFGIFGDYRGVPPREGFIIPILVFITMVVSQYRYAHYFFFLLLFTMASYAPARHIVGHFFYLNFGFSMFITLYTFYFVYVLSEQYLDIKHKIALLFSFSYTFVALGCFLVDVSQIYVRELDVIYWLKKYASYETFLFVGIIMSLLGLALFIYGVYSMYDCKNKEQLK
jgi:hypothetical protein